MSKQGCTDLTLSIAAMLSGLGLKSSRAHLSIHEMGALDKYHRVKSEQWVTTLFNTWNKELVGDLIVAEVKGRNELPYEILDGNHRHEVMKRKGVNHCWCKVYENVPESVRALIYLAGNNNTKSFQPLELLIAGYMAGVPSCVYIVKTLEKYGFVVPRYGSKFDGKSMMCPTQLLRVYNTKNGPETIEKVVRVIHDAWEEDVTDRTSSRIFSGLHYLLVNKKTAELVSIDKLGVALKRTRPASLFGSANTYRLGQPELSAARAVACAIRDSYNKSVPRKEHLPSLLGDEML